MTFNEVRGAGSPVRWIQQLLLSVFALCVSGMAGATSVTWSSVAVSDNNGGLYANTASYSTSGASNEVFDLLLPDYSASNFDSLFIDTSLSLALNATADDRVIKGFLFEIIGTFLTPDESATYDFNSGAASGSITASTSGILGVTIGSSQDLVGLLQLVAGAGAVSISEVRLTAQLPEPASLSLVAGALAALLAFRRKTLRARTSVAAAAAAALGLVAADAAMAQANDAAPRTAGHLSAAKVAINKKNSLKGTMSPMGAIAKRVQKQIIKRIQNGERGTFIVRGMDINPDPGEEDCDDCNFDPDFNFPGGGSNAEIRVAVDPTGMNVLIGFNDARGFAFSPTTLSGVAYSTDGGQTFVDGGRLPNGPTETVPGGAVVPQIFGDPDVKWVPGGTGCNFVYSSIMVKRYPATGPATGTAQTMSVHTSTDCGHTWTGPIEVTAATNPNGRTTNGSASDAADKEFIDVDPKTGRVLISWTNFAYNGQEIRASYSDNLFSPTPSWSSGVVVSPVGFSGTASVQASMPRFAGLSSNNAYIVWEQFSTSTDPSGYNKYNVGFSRSTDNGVTWSSPVSLTTPAQQPDQVLGNDRIHSFPSIAVDTSGGANDGNVYVTYLSNANLDGGDIMFQRSTDGGQSFSAPVSLSPRPGNDRSQWFPAIAVDKSTGRVNVIYYDQSVASSGDLMALTWVKSDNGGQTWSTPSRACVPPAGIGATNACDRPFHAGYGNDTSQPNLGDYIGVDALGGAAYASFAGTPKTVNYTDGQPAGSMTTPEVRFRKIVTGSPALDLGSISIVDSGGNGFIDAGDSVKMKVALSNFVTNPATSPQTYTNVTGTLTTTTPGVTIVRSTVSYPNIAPGATATNALEYVFTVAPGYVPGTPIDFQLALSTSQGTGSLAFYRNTGTPVSTTIFAENFDTTTVGNLPTGWVRSHGGGSNTVPWVTSNTFCGTGSNALFHTNANDAANPTRFERAFSPLVNVPAGAAYVTLEFDVCTDTEEDPSYNVLAYDGLMLRITDQTPGRTLRSVLVEAFAEEFTTGNLNHHPKHLPRNSSTSYLQDLSAWAGYSNGFKPVKLRLPGMQGSTVQMRWEYTQDSGGTCADLRPGHACGVMVDNIVMKAVTLKSDELATLSLVPVAGQAGTYTATVKAQPIAGASGISVALSSSNPGITTMPASVQIPAGSQVSAPFQVKIGPAPSGTTVTITATGASNARSAAVKIL